MFSKPSSDSDPRGLLAPRSAPGTCARCLDLNARSGGLCRNCGSHEPAAAVVLPISYSVGSDWLYETIVAYKRRADRSVPAAARALAAILDGFLVRHEACLASACRMTGRFDLVTTVPSSSVLRDRRHPLRRVVGELTPSTRDRHLRLLMRSAKPCTARRFDPERYSATRQLNGERILLVDDMWTTGASAESAAAALRAAGAGTVACVAIARHLNREWDLNDFRLRQIERRGFDFERCALCAEP